MVNYSIWDWYDPLHKYGYGAKYVPSGPVAPSMPLGMSISRAPAPSRPLVQPQLAAGRGPSDYIERQKLMLENFQRQRQLRAQQIQQFQRRLPNRQADQLTAAPLLDINSIYSRVTTPASPRRYDPYTMFGINPDPGYYSPLGRRNYSRPESSFYPTFA